MEVDNRPLSILVGGVHTLVNHWPTSSLPEQGASGEKRKQGARMFGENRIKQASFITNGRRMVCTDSRLKDLILLEMVKSTTQ